MKRLVAKIGIIFLICSEIDVSSVFLMKDAKVLNYQLQDGLNWIKVFLLFEGIC